MSERTRAHDERSHGTVDADVIVLGVGTGGEDLSLRLLDAGLSVIGIQHGLVGGECPFWACLPTKTMIRSTNALQEARRSHELAADVDPTPVWNKVAERTRATTGGWDDGAAIERYEAHGGRLVKGKGRLVGPRAVRVNGETYTASRGVVIGTGSRATIPPIPGLDGIDYWTTHDAVRAEELPDSLVVIGGGASGCELGQVFARFGADVTIVDSKDRLLHREEPEASREIEGAFASEGIEVRLGVRAERAAARNGSIVVTTDDGHEVVGERLLVAAGRTVDVSDLGLASVGLDSDATHLEPDENMRVTEGLWAMGDVTRRGFYSHVALYQSAIVAAQILGEAHPPAEYHAVPRATFTDPEVGSVGMTEAQAREAGLDVAVAIKRLPATFKGLVEATEHGIIKLIVDRATGQLVGATAVGPHGAEMLGLLNLAVHERLPLSTLRSMIYAFPTYYGAMGAAVGAWGRGLMLALDPQYDGLEHTSGVR